MTGVAIAAGTDPYVNQSFEQALLEQAGPGDAILYLWQNRDTCFIGRSQNAWKECRCALLEADGGYVTRRISGGGAVFHDLGNVNFSFIAGNDIYDEHRQMRTVLDALKKLGVACTLSGRNDMLLPNGSKCSGCAYRHEKNAALHHGTLLIESSVDKITKYLTPSKSKMASKGIESVRSRVGLLSDYISLTPVEAMDALIRQFEDEYGKAAILSAGEYDLQDKIARFRDPAWIYGETPAFDAVIEGRTEFGECQIMLSFAEGRIKGCRVYTDSLDTTLAQRVESLLPGRVPGRELEEDLTHNGLGPIAGLIRTNL